MVKDYKRKTHLIYIIVPKDNDISIKGIDRLSYIDLEIEIERIRHIKTTTVPIIVEATRMTKKGSH